MFAALPTLGEQQRRVVELAYIGFTQRDIAAITGCTLAEVQAHMLAGMRALHAILIEPFLAPDATD